MSPEQVVGRELDSRTDIFTLGIVLAELLIRRPLFGGGKELDVLIRIRDADLSAIDWATSRLADDVRAVLFRALSKDPSMRWPSAAAFAAAIEEIVRRRRLQVGPSRLASLIEHLGLVAEPTDSSSRWAAAVPVALPSDADTNPRPAFSGPHVADLARREDRSAGQPAHHYRVRRPDGSVLGPVGLASLIELFATGLIGCRCEIAKDDQGFRPAGEVPEVARFLSSPALNWDTDFQADAIDQGELDSGAAADTAVPYRRAPGDGSPPSRRRRPKKTDSLFVEGAPECVSSTDKNELLGEFLVERGQVLRLEVEMALATLPRFGGRLGDALVGIGVLRPIELFRAIKEQTQARLIDVFSWKTGRIAFARGVRSQEETFPLGVDTYESSPAAFGAVTRTRNSRRCWLLCAKKCSRRSTCHRSDPRCFASPIARPPFLSVFRARRRLASLSGSWARRGWRIRRKSCARCFLALRASYCEVQSGSSPRAS